MYKSLKTRRISHKYFLQSDLFRHNVAQCDSSDCNAKLLEAAEYGNVSDVREQLGNPSTNINCTNYMGLNALQLATQHEYYDIVEILLKNVCITRMGDSLLLAIWKGYERIVEMLLNHPSTFKEYYKYSPNELTQIDAENSKLYTYDGRETRFSPDISPIILAAEVLKILFIGMSHVS